MDFFKTKFFQWQIAIFKFAFVLAILLTACLFIIGNTLAVNVINESPSLIDSLLYGLRTFLALLLTFSIVNIFGTTFRFVSKIIKKNSG